MGEFASFLDSEAADLIACVGQQNCVAAQIPVDVIDR